MNPKTITIDDQEYVRADSANQKPTKKQIVILQRGWIVIGDVSKDGADFQISNCAVIRNWGTTSGLGELAEKGPLQNTRLDKCPDVFAHELGVVGRMNVNEANWNG